MSNFTYLTLSRVKSLMVGRKKRKLLYFDLTLSPIFYVLSWKSLIVPQSSNFQCFYRDYFSTLCVCMPVCVCLYACVCESVFNIVIIFQHFVFSF